LIGFPWLLRVPKAKKSQGELAKSQGRGWLSLAFLGFRGQAALPTPAENGVLRFAQPPAMARSIFPIHVSKQPRAAYRTRRAALPAPHRRSKAT
jgi:hypothetical protein